MCALQVVEVLPKSAESAGQMLTWRGSRINQDQISEHCLEPQFETASEQLILINTANLNF